MSLYLNIGNEGFASARNGEYVDKSGLIAVMNSTLHTERRFSCVTRCRRFGKSMAAKMLSAYYDCSCDSRHLFHDLEIARHPSFEKYLNNAVNSANWQQLISSIGQSRKLIQATFDGDEQAVAKAIDAAHDENTSILSYNDENSQACVLSIAYDYARNDYVVVRELPTGKGFADLVLIPRKRIDKPAILLELEYDKAADAAVGQIKRKEYAGKLRQLTGSVILVGINYDKTSEKHTCRYRTCVNINFIN